MTESTEKTAVQWFVECDPFTNESLESGLAEYGISDAESKFVGVPGSDSRKHDVILIPSSFVKKLRAAKQCDKRFKFRFWKRNGPEGIIYPADFVEKKAPIKKLREAEERLKEIRVAKK